MPITHLLFALLVVLVWGFNFIFVKFALEEIPPLLLSALRFFLASVPVIFFIKPPALNFRLVALYGLVMFALQFSLFFIGMYIGMTPGMASLLMQTQVFFSLFFAAVFLQERVNVWQIIGALISFMGIGLVALHVDQNVSFLGFICILGAAAAWGLGNLVTKKNNEMSMMALVVWGSFVACFPLLIATLLFDGPKTLLFGLRHLSWLGTFSVLYIVYASTWVGYGLWNWLLSRYPVSTVVPFTLLVPVIGLLSSVIVLDEPFQLWKLVACLLVISGLFINLFGARFVVAKMPQELS